MTTNKIMKECPYCGEKNIFPSCKKELKITHPIRKITVNIGFHVFCQKCATYGPRGKTPEEADKLWNKRKGVKKCKTV